MGKSERMTEKDKREREVGHVLVFEMETTILNELNLKLS